MTKYLENQEYVVAVNGHHSFSVKKDGTKSYKHEFENSPNLSESTEEIFRAAILRLSQQLEQFI